VKLGVFSFYRNNTLYPGYTKFVMNLIKMQIPANLVWVRPISHLVSFATIGVCVFCAVTSVAALFILEEKEMKKIIALVMCLVFVLSTTLIFPVSASNDVYMIFAGETDDGCSIHPSGFGRLWGPVGENAELGHPAPVQGNSSYCVNTDTNQTIFFHNTNWNYPATTTGVFDATKYEYIELDLYVSSEIVCDFDFGLCSSEEDPQGACWYSDSVWIPGKRWTHIRIPIAEFGGFTAAVCGSLNSIKRIKLLLTNIVDAVQIYDGNFVVPDCTFVYIDNVVATRNGEGKANELINFDTLLVNPPEWFEEYRANYNSNTTICDHNKTEVRNVVTANCGNDGYTGDTYCYDCKKIISYGTIIPAPGNHVGGTATCIAKATCSVCGQKYGEVDTENHKNIKVRNATAANCGNNGYTGDTYCFDCGKTVAYGTIIPATGNHVGGTATCIAKATCYVCGQKYGEYNPTNHTGSTVIYDNVSPTDCTDVGYTGDICCSDCGGIIEEGEEFHSYDNHKGEFEIRDAIPYDCGNDGYTGDTYCIGCGTMVKEGVVISATGNHLGGEATCCTKAKCEDCGEEYGDFDTKNHKYTEVRDCIEASCVSIGYTGNTYCLDCGELVKAGNIIPATNIHTGGTATCCTTAVCSVCHKEYGDYDTNTHTGETEVRNACSANCGNNGYTGDTYCLGCDILIEVGQVVPATNDHAGGIATCGSRAVCEVCSQEYGTVNTNKHIGGIATCCTKAVCDLCGQEYGDFIADNHKGKGQFRNASAHYTGDVYCLGCDEIIIIGQQISPYGDVDGNNSTNIIDAMLIAQYSAKVIDKFPVEQ